MDLLGTELDKPHNLTVAGPYAQLALVVRTAYGAAAAPGHVQMTPIDPCRL